MTGNHVLTAAQFDGLARGYGGSAAMAVLRAGQLSRRKLVLNEVIRRIGRSPVLDLLGRTEVRAPRAIAELLLHPHLDVWAVQALRGGQEFDYLALVAAAAAARSGEPFRMRLPMTHGRAYLPGVGAVRGPEEAEHVTVTAEDIGGPRWEPLRTIELEPGWHLAIEDLEPFRDCYRWQPEPRLDPGVADRFGQLLRDAWRILTDRYPDHAEAMRVLLRSVVPLVRPASGISVSATSRHASGSVAVVIPATAEELCLLLLHEFMHMKLDALGHLVELHTPDGNPRFLAPWRMDPRPVGALFQGIYAHTGVTDYWRARRREPTSPRVADLEFAYWRRQNAVAIASLASSGELTGLGDRFVERLRGTLDEWAEDPVTAEAEAKAADMVLAQTVRWRMRNWQPSPAEIDQVAVAWRRGAAPGHIESQGAMRDEKAPAAPADLPGIVGMIRASMTIDEVSDPAAKALIVGRRSAACLLYTRRVTISREDEDAWIGWALTAEPASGAALSLRQRPDLVREALRVIPEAKPDAFAQWLGKALTPDLPL